MLRFYSSRLHWKIPMYLAGALIAASCANDLAAIYGDANADYVYDDLGRTLLDPATGEYLQIDINQDGLFDGIGIDTDFDGFVDALGFDQSGNSIIDALDKDGDLLAEVFSRYATGLSTSSTTVSSVADDDAVTNNNAATAYPEQSQSSSSQSDAGGGLSDLPLVPELSLGAYNGQVLESARDKLAFEYERWKRKYLNDCGGGVTSIPTFEADSSKSVVSEGIAYGMLITAALGSKAEFSGVYQFYVTANKSSGGLMAWRCGNSCGGCTDNAASDADLDVAMALLQAHQRWPSAGYEAAATSLITKIRAAVVSTCGGGTFIVAGEWDQGICDLINPSYFAPGYYKVFAKYDSAGASTWNAMVDSAYVLLNASRANGPNSLWPDASDTSGNRKDGFANNGYDAIRVPWRIATDYVWTADARALSLMQYMQTKIDSSGYGPLSTNSNSAFFGALSLTGQTDAETAQAYYDEWQNATLQDNAYYQATLRMVYLLLSAGQFPSTL